MQIKVKSLHLKDYKRFTDLWVGEIPKTVRLVVLVGPNGSGKSSLFDAFILKAGAEVTIWSLSGNHGEYYEKLVKAQRLDEIAQRVKIEFHGNENVDMKSAFQVRSAYRNQADFQVEQFKTAIQNNKGPRLDRIIDVDAAVSDNFMKMAGKGLDDLFYAASDDMTLGEYRKETIGDLQNALRELFEDPELLLQDFGAMKYGSFRFSKGKAKDFHYKNLSGGEKAAFDILLDVFVKREDAPNAVFCIDEPELHVAHGLQGRLISTILKLLPPTTQLWVATHSIGVVREAYRIHQEQPDKVSFIDFSNHDFDNAVTIKPSIPNRAFWANIYEITLDDLASLVAPHKIILCEGNADKIDKSFDASCYNKIFSDEYPDTLFISRGGSKEVIKSKHLTAIIKQIAQATEVFTVIDRDDMTDIERQRKIADKIHVLRRRELEDYLYDPEVISTFLRTQGVNKKIVKKILNERQNLLADQSGPVNLKDISRDLFNRIRTITRLPTLGNNREEFALQYLVPALRKTRVVYEELKEDVFWNDNINQ